MSEVKFTPGPWAIHTIDHSHWVGVPTLNGEGLEKPIFKIESDPFYKEEVKAEAIANARLVACAPDMYDAIQCALNIKDLWSAQQHGTVSADHEGEMQALQAMQDKLEAAINKATL